MLPDKLGDTSFRRQHVVESFDDTSLYTNVSNENATHAVAELLDEHSAALNMYGLTTHQVMTLLQECLECAIFRWAGQYYRQIRRLVMGQRTAPTSAIVVMSEIGNPILERRPILYWRYIDDCIIVCSTQKEMDTCFSLLN